jgi:crotonobetainyl-CoA:carnitine CoA-transferase CaiB-like acyl-CoA transferase
VSTALTDIVAGTVAAFAVTAALFRRERTGEGELVDISILEAGLALMSPRIAAYLAGEAEPRPSGGTDSVLSVYQSFETADQPIVLAVGNDRMWQRCCDVLGLTSLAEDPELATNAGRRARRAGLIAPIKQVLMTRPAAEWLGRFAAAGVPCQPVQRLSDVVSDPHVLARGMIDEHQHPRTGSFSTVRAPWRLESSGRGRFGIAPALGEHTLDVLRDIGLSEAEIDQLLEDEVIWDVVPATP